jgi:hypothetical protein
MYGNEQLLTLLVEDHRQQLGAPLFYRGIPASVWRRALAPRKQR